jgi:hypothetical protein
METEFILVSGKGQVKGSYKYGIETFCFRKRQGVSWISELLSALLHRVNKLCLWMNNNFLYLRISPGHVAAFHCTMSWRSNQPTPWSWVLEKPPVEQVLNNFPIYYGARRFIQCSQKLSAGSYSVLDESDHIILSYFSKIHLNIILPPTSRYS